MRHGTALVLLQLDGILRIYGVTVMQKAQLYSCSMIRVSHRFIGLKCATSSFFNLRASEMLQNQFHLSILLTSLIGDL